MTNASYEERNAAKPLFINASLISGSASLASLIYLLASADVLYFQRAILFTTQKKQAWAAYVNKYGKNGVVPEHVKMIHRKLIAQGKKISV